MASTVNGGVDTERVALLWLLAASTSRSLSFAFAACSIHPQPITAVAAFRHELAEAGLAAVFWLRLRPGLPAQ